MKGFDAILITAGEVVSTLLRFAADDYAEAAGIDGLSPGEKAAVQLVAQWRLELGDRATPAPPPTPRTP